MFTIVCYIIFYLERFTEDDAQKEITLNDQDEVFTELRHQHIYNAAE